MFPHIFVGKTGLEMDSGNGFIKRIKKWIFDFFVFCICFKGRLYVVGCNNFGQLGLGPSTQGSSGPTSINRPVQVIAGGLSAVSIAQVSCGENHTVCLDNRGRVYCFGDNYYGQSGCHLNHYENVHYPMKVEHFKKQYGARIVKVSSGKYHVVALDNRGRVFCWGLGGMV